MQSSKISQKGQWNGCRGDSMLMNENMNVGSAQDRNFCSKSSQSAISAKSNIVGLNSEWWLGAEFKNFPKGPVEWLSRRFNVDG